MKKSRSSREIPRSFKKGDEVRIPPDVVGYNVYGYRGQTPVELALCHATPASKVLNSTGRVKIPPPCVPIVLSRWTSFTVLKARARPDFAQGSKTWRNMCLIYDPVSGDELYVDRCDLVHI